LNKSKFMLIVVNKPKKNRFIMYEINLTSEKVETRKIINRAKL